ncbi:hypothetical protein VPHK379_0061 [Vibrio phage K379]
MKLKLLLLTSLAALLPVSAFADNANANFSSTVQSYCTVGLTSPGVMHLENTTLSTDTPATLAINNNEANIYQVSVQKPSDFATKPNSYLGSTTFTTAFGVAGDNPTVNPVGDGAAHPLAASGSDTLSLTLFGSSDLNYQAGDYTAVAVVSCVPQ